MVDVKDVDVKVVLYDRVDAPLLELDPASAPDGLVETVVDKDLDAFSVFYTRTLMNGSLSSFERAAIKTYIAWKLGIRKQ